MKTEQKPGHGFFLKQAKDGSSGNPEHDPQEALDGGEGGSRLVCRRCRFSITSTGARTNVHGSHKHVFFNPNGNVFEIGCFTRAPGCKGVGPSTSEFTWFAGYTWQIGVCAACQTHLGWIYSSSRGSGFYGLILGALEEKAEG